MRVILLLLGCILLSGSPSAQIVSEFGQVCGGGGATAAGSFGSSSTGGLPCVGTAGSGAYSNLAGSYTLPSLSVGVDDGEESLPFDWSLAQNYPNPFNPCTEIHFSLRQACRVRLDVYNIVGQRVKTLVDNDLPAGPHKVEWDGTSESGHPAATGIYLYRLTADDFVQSKKMLLLK